MGRSVYIMCTQRVSYMYICVRCMRVDCMYVLFVCGWICYLFVYVCIICAGMYVLLVLCMCMCSLCMQQLLVINPHHDLILLANAIQSHAGRSCLCMLSPSLPRCTHYMHTCCTPLHLLRALLTHLLHALLTHLPLALPTNLLHALPTRLLHDWRTCSTTDTPAARTTDILSKWRVLYLISTRTIIIKSSSCKLLAKKNIRLH